MQSFIVLASLVSELAGRGGSQNDPSLVLNVTKTPLSFKGWCYVGHDKCLSVLRISFLE